MAEHIIAKLDPGYVIRRRPLILGRRLEPGEVSRSGLYCIATTKCSHPLRVTLFTEAASLLSDEDTRYIAEAFLDISTSAGTASACPTGQIEPATAQLPPVNPPRPWKSTSELVARN